MILADPQYGCQVFADLRPGSQILRSIPCAKKSSRTIAGFQRLVTAQHEIGINVSEIRSEPLRTTAAHRNEKNRRMHVGLSCFDLQDSFQSHIVRQSESSHAFSRAPALLTCGNLRCGTFRFRKEQSGCHPSPSVIRRISRSSGRSLKYSRTSLLWRSYRSR